MSNLFIPVILGTAREGRQSEQAARFVQQQVEAAGVSSELIDVREWGKSATLVDWMDNADDTKPWIAKAESADGFIIVSPEYNNLFPGELKLFLDQTLKPYARKPAGLVGVSSGNWGGTRVVETLRQYVSRLGMVAVQPPAYFPNIGDAFDEAGEPTDPQATEHLTPMIDDVIWYAEVLKPARERS